MEQHVTRQRYRHSEKENVVHQWSWLRLAPLSFEEIGYPSELLMPRILLLGIVLFLTIPFGIDWALAQTRLPSIDMIPTLEQPSVVADGRSKIAVTVRVTENGVPRVNDLLQSWIDVGGGLLQPQWAYTDANGEATLNFSPNPITQYDVQDRAVIHVRNTSIGRLIEVGKDLMVDIPLTLPEQEEQRGIFG